MKHRRIGYLLSGLAVWALLSACAATGPAIASPVVTLTTVELERASLDRQTFLLGFSVTNPNPFPLPVRDVRYRVLLDEERFAGGEVVAGFTVPAEGSNAFAISVDLDILGSARQLTSLLSGGMPDHVSYELQGSLTIDIPLARPIPFTTTGLIEVQD